MVVVGGGVRGFPLGKEFVGGANDGWGQEQWAGHPNTLWGVAIKRGRGLG